MHLCIRIEKGIEYEMHWYRKVCMGNNCEFIKWRCILFMFILFSKHFKIDSTQNIFTTLTFSILYMGRRVHGEHGVYLKIQRQILFSQ